MKTVICNACGYHGPARTYGCMRIGILLFLSCFGLVPGIIYAIWADSYIKRCPNCDQKTIIPADSPRGQQISPSGVASIQSPPSGLSFGTIAMITIALLIGGCFVAISVITSTPQREALPQRQTPRIATTTTTATAQQELVTIAGDQMPSEETLAQSREAARLAAVRDLEEWRAARDRRLASSVFLDETRGIYHAQNCRDVDRRFMPLASPAMAMLKNLKPHSCVTDLKSTSTTATTASQ